MIVCMKRYDLVVIGAGSGGLVAAEYAARFGASVALVEKSHLLGGDCLNQGCVPSKALIYAGKTFYRARHAEKFGTMTYPELDFSKVKQSIEEAKQRIRSLRDNDEYYERLGVDIYHEHARFISTNKIKAGNREIEGSHFIISTGSKPRVPDIPGLSKVDVYTNETIFDIEKFPKRLGVIGGGVIGCEIASAFNHLGSEVTLFERHGHLSLRADKDASEFVQDRFLQRGMKIKTKSAVDAVKQSKKGIKIDYTIKKKDYSKYVDAIFVSIGRLPNIDLGLDNAGVKYSDRGIETDDYGRTSNKNVWAVGDVTGKAGFTHVAAEQAFYATMHALFGYKKKVSLETLPYVIFTSPEVAHVGKTVQELEDSGTEYELHTTDYTEIDRALIEDKSGLVQVMTDKKGNLLGATMVGSHATEQIGQYVVAMNRKMKMKDLAEGMLPYPTFATATKIAAMDYRVEEILASKHIRRAIKAAKFFRR